MKLLRRTRRRAYRLASLLGDVEAVASGRPSRILRRAGNKLLGRKLVRRLWMRR